MTDSTYAARYYREKIAPKLGRRPAEMRVCALPGCPNSRLMRPQALYCSLACRQKAYRARLRT